MADMTSLTQKDLNKPLRGLTSVEIMTFLPDKNIFLASNAVTVNKEALPYTSRLHSIVELSAIPQPNIATFENNLWILDGSFILPSESYSGGGDSYSGYISEELTDDSGDYVVNPVITVTFAAVAPKVEYVSVRFVGGVSSSYPKTLEIRTYSEDDTLIETHRYNTSEQTGLPLLVAELNDENVKKVTFTLVGTVCPHRRSRLSKIMFGKAEIVNPDFLQSWKVDDKASLVADSIPTKTLTYNIIDFEGNYNIDNPGNKIPVSYKDTLVFFSLAVEEDGLWRYAPTKIFNLKDVSTSADGLVTFECGSILDVLTETYDQETYINSKTIDQVMKNLCLFSGISTDQYDLGEFGGYKIDIPIPEMPVREIIQRLAFSCGATLTVNNDNIIVFSKKNIVPKDDTPKFVFHYIEPFDSAAVLLEEPHAEALEHTTNIGMYTYTASTDRESSTLGSSNISTITPTRISFSAAAGTIQFDEAEIGKQHARIVRIEDVHSQHAVITLTWDETSHDVTLPIKVSAIGKAVKTTKSMPKTVTSDTLLLDSGLASTVPDNLIKPLNPDPTTFYYTDWYGAKFKYICSTRKEYLVKAGDIIYFETPFSNGEADRVGYVLRNAYSNDGDKGEMEVILIG